MRRLFPTTLALVGSTLPIASWAQITISLFPTEDAVIAFHDNYNTANNNADYADYYGACSQPGSLGGENASHALMKFDMTQIPGMLGIISAELHLHGRGSPGHPGAATSVGNIGANSCYLERITAPWLANTVTWNTQPATTSQNTVTLQQSTMILQDYFGIDVKDMVLDMVNDPTNSHGFSIRLVNETPTAGLFFCSTEFADTTKHPELVVTLEVAGSGVGELSAGPIPELLHPSITEIGANLTIRSVGQVTGDRLMITDPMGRIIADERITSARPSSWTVPSIASGSYTGMLVGQRGVKAMTRFQVR